MDSPIFKPFHFHLKNDTLYLKNIININLFKVLCEVNKKFVKNIHIQTVENNIVHAFIVMNHLFKDLGIPQFFLKLIVEFDDNNQNFIIKSSNNIDSELPFQYDENLQLLENISLTIHYTKMTDHHYQYSIQIKHEIKEELYEELDEIVEKVIFKLINVIFTNLNKSINEYVC
jgi:hypothetical protein